MSETKDLEIIKPREMVRADDFMPLLSVQQAVDRKGQINQFIGQVLKEGDDYGKMPGDQRKDAKKVLLKPGAEKLCSIFGLAPQYLEDKIVEDWTGAEHGGEPLFYYAYRCQLMRGDRFMGEAIGSANSWEVKYRYRWVNASNVPNGDITGLVTKGGTAFEFQFAIDKAETSGKYGKPAEYWKRFKDSIEDGSATPVQKDTKNGKRPGWEIDQTIYRIPNPDTADIINTLQKMAQKRALVAAVLVVTNCSDAFTQDLEDAELDPNTSSGAPTATQETLPAEEHMLKLPEELASLFGPDAPAKGTTTAFEICRRELIETIPSNGEDEYRRILALNHITAKGPNKIGDVKKACIQCWTLARSIKVKNGWKDPHAESRSAQGVQDGDGVDDWGEGRE